MSDQLSAPRAVFEPTDLLDFGPLPTSPPSSRLDLKDTRQGDEIGDKQPEGAESMGMDIDVDAEFAMMEENLRTTNQRMNVSLESPPPVFEREPDGREEKDSAPSARLTAVQNGSHEHIARTESSEPRFIPSDLLGDGPVDPGPSARKIVLTPPPEMGPSYLYEPIEALCTLPSLRAATASGSRILFRRRNRPKPPTIASDANRNLLSADTANLLTTPLHRLLAEVDELKSRDEAVRLQTHYDQEQQNGAVSAAAAAASSSASMWVDRYRPKKFSDLLGEDRVHREVLSWLKEWDKCVFKRAVHVKRRRVDEGDNPYITSADRENDQIVLLSGPPGYGKTTLAHVVARQAGYRTLEINASDDRSAATVSTRIKNAIDAGTGLGSEGRPTCVVIDEIDGASGGGDTSFIRSLIKLIQDIPARRKTNTPAKPLRRPIICICNDLWVATILLFGKALENSSYASSLRPLRPFARIIRFRKPQAQFLIKRLRDICERESLTADLRCLTTLVEMTTGDVRSCLNTLQFIKSRSTVVTDEAIKSSSVGLKDTGTTLSSVWASLFIPISAKARRKAIGIDDGRYVDRLAFEVQACGDYEKLVQGLFEHYPNLKPLDASLYNLNRLHDWVEYYDRLMGKISEAMEFELMSYLPYAIVPWYSHMAAPANNAKPTEWPKADYEAYQTRLVNDEVSTTTRALLPPILRSLFSSTLLTELIPLLMRIITPPLKPVNANIVKSAEKITLDRLVDLMLGLGLKFWAEKGENGQPMMRLEPPIDVFVHYEGKRADDIAASRFAVRSLVAQAMDAEQARRRGNADSAESNNAEKLKGLYGVAKKGKAGRDVGKSEAIATDFFGRTIVKSLPTLPVANGETESEVTLTNEQPQKRFRAIYKFHEGSSSAVRKSIKMSVLM